MPKDHKIYQMNKDNKISYEKESVRLTKYKTENDLFEEQNQTQETLNQEYVNKIPHYWNAFKERKKSFDLLIDSLNKKINRFGIKNSELLEEIDFLKEDVNTLGTEKEALYRDIARVLEIINRQEEKKQLYNQQIKAITKKIALKQPEIEWDSDLEV